jgi:hypothetical protein
MRKAFFHSAQGFPGQSNTNIENVQVNIQIWDGFKPKKGPDGSD